MNGIDWVLNRGREEGEVKNSPSLHDGPSDLMSFLKKYPVIERICQNRGLHSSASIENWIFPKLSDLRDPFSIKDMDLAVDRLLQALKNQETVAIYGDFDLDGTPGVALLREGLSALGFESIKHYQPKRLSEGYGFHIHAVEKLKEQGVSLIVTVDVGITDIETVDRAQQIGVDVIVTDHHLPKMSEGGTDFLIPKAVAVVNPNRPDCSSGLGHLCGTGVGFFLILALRRCLQEQGLLNRDFNPKSLLDLFAVATLTDMVPLVEENRVLVKHGILELAKTQRPGLQLLLKELGLWGRPLTGDDVAIRFSPKLNALSRMEMGTLPLDVFLVDSVKKAKELIVDVMDKNQLRVKLQKEAEAHAIKVIGENADQPFVWVYSKDYHKGVVGLVATKLSQKYWVPAFVGSCTSEDTITGSARLPDDSSGVNLVEALSSAKESLSHFGGHAAASGFSLSLDNAESLGKSLNQFFSNQRPGASPSLSQRKYDAAMVLRDLTPDFMKWYESLGPFGVGFESPVFCIENLTLESVRELSGGHLKLKVKDNEGYCLEALWFYPDLSHEIFENGDLLAGMGLSVLAEPQWNYFAGRRSLQLLLKDIRNG